MPRLIASLFVLSFLVGCGSEKVTKADSKPVVEQSADKPLDLEKCPCGEEKWEEPPPGYSNPK